MKWIMREQFERLGLRIDESNKQISDFGVALRGLDQVVSKMAGMEGSYRFQEHYQHWRSQRTSAIISHYGPLWFKGKRVLELGCGHGDIGSIFSLLGADVTFSDARSEHLDTLRQRYPFSNTVLANCENEWPFEGRFDLILHLGLLYHLKDFEFSLNKSLDFGGNVVLETEVCDSNDPNQVSFVKEDDAGYDQSFGGVGSRPSPAYLERVFHDRNASFERLTDASCNSSFHCYDWRITNSGEWRHGLRRLWFIRPAPSGE